MSLNPPVFEVLPRDLSAYRKGNVGIDYVHRFESGRPGPHVLINALTHGNEICGMVAATHLLDTGVRPRIGTLTISFANVAAYESFDQSRPFESRQLVHNLNRIWSAGELDGAEASPELDRARVLRPVVLAPVQPVTGTWRTPVKVDPIDVPIEEKVKLLLAANAVAHALFGNIGFGQDKSPFAVIARNRVRHAFDHAHGDTTAAALITD